MSPISHKPLKSEEEGRRIGQRDATEKDMREFPSVRRILGAIAGSEM